MVLTQHGVAKNAPFLTGQELMRVLAATPNNSVLLQALQQCGPHTTPQHARQALVQVAARQLHSRCVSTDNMTEKCTTIR